MVVAKYFLNVAFITGIFDLKFRFLALRDSSIPPAAFVNVPLIELLFTFCVPVAGTITVFAMKVILPVVFTFRFVKVLLLIACDNVAAVFEI